ncbi:MAG TPA: DUF1540 domain-containing protein [Bacillota bacterium]|nr:DUF1540 domain-containing protein [Bacillota bacterium]
MPDVNVKCSVSNCTYWGKENNCTASEIMVDVDQHASYVAEMAAELGTDHHDIASTAAITCCKTFKPKHT